jgi:DNA-binding NarL/FixJ family response regulator
MTNEGEVRIGVVASTPLRLLGLAAILERIPGVRVVELELDAAAYEEGLGLLVLDLRTPMDTVLFAVGRVLRQQPASRILVLGHTAILEEVQTLIAAGAKGFLPENASEDEIRMAAEVVLDGSIWGPRKVLARLIEEKLAVESAAPEDGAFEVLFSQRQREVLSFLKHGRSNTEIAAALDVEESTVKAHISKMMRKAHANSRLELTMRAIAAGQSS